VGERIDFSEWLQAEMNKRGWSQSDLARSADLNRAVINKLINGKSHPQPSPWESISRACGFPSRSHTAPPDCCQSTPDNDETIEEAIHVLKSIQSAQRKATAIALLKALITEEEKEQQEDKTKR
jgi:ribosome-binding protein aMBF1 (putative translation factor)